MSIEQNPISHLVLAHMSPEWSYCAEPLGVLILKGQVLNKWPDAKVTIVDSQLEKNNRKMAEKIGSLQPAVLGLSLTPGSKKHAEMLLDELLLSLLPEDKPVLVFGNVGATFSFNELLAQYPNALVVQGEGEKTVEGIVDYLLEKRKLETIPNLVYKKDGEIVRTEQKTPDLNKLAPPAREDSQKYIDAEIQNIAETSRGCKYYCTFCNRHTFFSNTRQWRGFPINYVINDLETLSSMGTRGLTLADEDFFQGGTERAQSIANRLITSKKEGRIAPDFQITLALRVDDIYSEKDIDVNNVYRQKALALLKQAGLVWVFMGVESGSSTQLTRFGKGISIEETKKASAILEQLGVGVEAGFIMFDPFMTLKDIRENILFLKDTGLYKYIAYPFSTLRAEPGSAILKEIQKAGLIRGDYDYNWLEFPYNFQDKGVESIVKICHRWREKTDSLIPMLKRRYREKVYQGGIHMVEGQRLFYYAGLNRLIFLNLLEAATDVVEFKQGDDTLRIAMDYFDQQIGIIASNVLQDIQQGIISDKEKILTKASQEFLSKIRT